MPDRTWKGNDATNPGNPNIAANWFEAAVPIAGDRQIFNDRALANLDANLAALAAITGTIIVENFTKRIGDGTTAYSTACTLIEADANSDRMMFDTGAAAVTANVRRTSKTSADTGLQPFRIKGTNLTLNISGASGVGVAQRTGETATLTMLRVATGSEGTPTIEIGRGVTIATLLINAGTVRNLCEIAMTGDVLVDGGTYNYEGTGNHNNLTIRKGSKCYYSGTGAPAITAKVLAVYGILDGSRDSRVKTVAGTARFYASASIDLDNGVNTSWVFTNPIEWPDGFPVESFKTAINVKGTLTNI